MSGSPSRDGELLHHLAPAADWTRWHREGQVRPASLESEGFVHLSTSLQVVATANRHYAGVPDLVLLWVDASAVDAPLVFENTTGGSEPFPHLYGAIPVSAVVAAAAWPLGPDGLFGPPPAPGPVAPAGA